jgi:(heptosyl)LPS beta-1,4-glucosyltransferase
MSEVILKTASQSPRIPVSAVVLTKNEEANIGRCLQSLVDLDQVLVVDGFSTDRTVQIANSYGNVQVLMCEWRGFSGSKKFGRERARNRWVLWIDADEALTPELRESLAALWKSGEPTADVYSIVRKTWFVSDWVLHCGWYPENICRLFRTDKADFDDKYVHEGLQILPSARVSKLSGELEHYSFSSLAVYFQKQLKYALLGTEELARKGAVFSLWKTIGRALFAFFRVYILRAGFLDGRVGLVIAVGTAFATFAKYVGLGFPSETDGEAPK